MRSLSGLWVEVELPDQDPPPRLPVARYYWRAQDRSHRTVRSGPADDSTEVERTIRVAFTRQVAPNQQYKNQKSTNFTYFRRSAESNRSAGSSVEECREIRDLLDDCHAGLARCDALLDQLEKAFIERFGISPFSSEPAEPVGAPDSGRDAG
jgi:hypothetical protein